MALGRVLGGGSSINGLVWGRGMQRDFDGWAQNGASGWGFDDVLPVYKAQEDWEGGAKRVARRWWTRPRAASARSASGGSSVPGGR
jgi:choline dehydrogenase-like flavoprotein